MRHTRLVTGAAAAMFLAGCGSSSLHAAPPMTAAPVVTTSTPTTPAPTTTSPPTTVAPTTTTTVPNPDLIPAVITPAYVNAVFKVLNHVWGDSLRLDLATTNVPPQSLADLRSIFNNPLYTREENIAIQEFATDLSNVREPPGDDITTVKHLISASPTCIFAQTITDVSKVVYKIPAQGTDYFELTLKQSGIDPEDLNPTPWALTANNYFPNSPPTSQPDPCDAAS
jgi:hypothetical protein